MADAKESKPAEESTLTLEEYTKQADESATLKVMFLHYMAKKGRKGGTKGQLDADLQAFKKLPASDL